MICTALKNNKEIYVNPQGLPQKVYFGGFVELFTRNFGRYMINSLTITVTSLSVCLVLGLFISYALSRFQYKIGKYIYFYILIGMMIPTRMGILNLVDLINLLKLNDSKLGLSFIYMAMALPFTIFILYGFINMIPKEIDEAAVIDGCSTFRIIGVLMVPMLMPALVTVITYNFMSIWNDAFFPLIFLRGEQSKTLILAVTLFFGQFSTNWNLAFSALTIAALPTITVYLIFSKWLVSGIMSSAVKG
jgi:raffinose/stachyose/melibiose transport system permease protein